jgi:hypothetical protein
LDKDQLNRDVREFLRKRHRQLKKDAAVKPNKLNTFQWDYSYTPWKDLPVELRREWARSASWGRTSVEGRTTPCPDVFKYNARKMYNENWDGCRDLWKERYRKRKLYRNIDRPIVDDGTDGTGFSREYREREAAKGAEFNRKQQERYERWLKKFSDL